MLAGCVNTPNVPTPSASPSDLSSRLRSGFRSASNSMAPQNNNADGEVTFHSDYTSDPVEVNNVRVEPRFHASNHVCLQGANEPVRMLPFVARNHCDLSFRD